MSSINFHTKEISIKIVYYGPGLCGKTTSLQTVYRSLPENRRPQLVSLATDVDRTIFFDFLPLAAYRIRDFTVRLQLYTVPGQVFYNATRKLVLNGVDGIVFVTDSQRAMKDSNLESLQNLAENLGELGLEFEKIPMIMHFNKRDLVAIHSVEEMDRIYNQRRVPVFATIATTGEGLFDGLKTITQLVINDLVRKGLGAQIGQPPAPPPAAETPQSGPTSMAEAVVQAARPQNRTGMLWPAGAPPQLTERLDQALAQARWSEAVLACDEILQQAARAWAATQAEPMPDPLLGFLLAKQAPPARYNSLRRAVLAARTGRPVQQAEAISALILALHAMW